MYLIVHSRFGTMVQGKVRMYFVFVFDIFLLALFKCKYSRLGIYNGIKQENNHLKTGLLK